MKRRISEDEAIHHLMPPLSKHVAKARLRGLPGPPYAPADVDELLSDAEKHERRATTLAKILESRTAASSSEADHDELEL
ncbi:hypothetical protein F8O01_17620 [Pseudoclavibacter chungangensis]|uniref:Uncharacterized protein n=1 Tax=Pseudoclavibacter chungangensis TaxID=587635 RepID=A0A7J5BMM8_9MICO|nr:hypothetical protein [Pseudoclavibacter chungangensis]KAB1651745.1 hypothetical protein F8O01_17620 [Pseudoclavibacter chungangensis]NYJ68772.1 hypothetical protein [Pseudoclavibacter chungangensis]